MSYREVLKHIALSTPLNFIIRGKRIGGGALYRLKSEPSKLIMLCRYGDGDKYFYTIHTFNSNLDELDSATYGKASDIGDIINPDNLIYATEENEWVLVKAKQWITHLQSAKLNNTFTRGY